MGANSFGQLFSFTSFGESHGPAVGCVVDGCPARIPLSPADLQPRLDQRRPGRSQYVTPRREEDQAEILSGVHQGLTTGHPILILVRNQGQRSADYLPVHDLYRPGHADAAYQLKYGIRDPRGGGRASARETVARVAAAGVAARVLAAHPETAGLSVRAGLVALGPIVADPAKWRDDAIDANPFFCPDPEAAAAMPGVIEAAMAAGTSLGGVVEIRARGVPAGLGEPVYDRLDGRIGQACLGLNAVKGVEIGDGFALARLDGRAANDPLRSPASGRLEDTFVGNHAGGMLGGISTGQEIVVRCALKPTPSIRAEQQTVDKHLNNVALALEGRHDPAVCIRAAPVLEATMLLVLTDFFLLKRARDIVPMSGAGEFSCEKS